MTERAPVIVIGAGHNGLICATYLARAGRKVILLEANAAVGGASSTHEFHPGFRVSTIAHLLHGFDPIVARDLDLGRHGLRMAQDDLRTVALHPTEKALVFSTNGNVTGPAPEIDQAAWRRFLAARERYSSALGRWHSQAPPRLLANGWREVLPLAKLAWSVRRLGRRDMRELLRVATMSVDDWLNEYFSSPRIKGALALDAVLGTRAGPRSGGTVFTTLHRAAAGGRLALPQGGMGSLANALAAAASFAGVELRLNSRVAALEVSAGRVTGVRLTTGETLIVGVIVSALDPRQTFLSLLGVKHLEAEFSRRVQHVRAIGTAARLHLALSSAPDFQGVSAADLGQRLVIAPDSNYVERAFNPVKYREHSLQPVMEILLPSLLDKSLAPAGQHVLSATVQYAPHDLNGGWAQARERFLELCLATLEQYAPGLRARILHAELLTPADIERRIGITGAHWHHGELALDQYLMLRPVPGAAQYATPVAGLYLCSAGTHPGGGVLGIAGRHASAAVLAGGDAP